jgi:hypothetical protein
MPTPRIDAIDIHDVYQPVTDWTQATNHRLMSCKITEGRGNPRPGGIEYFKKFREHGVPFRGMYHWIRSDSPVGDQVAALGRGIDALGGLRPGEFIQLDWETTNGIPNVTVDAVEAWLALVEQRWPGRVVVYASDWVPGFQQWRSKNPTTPLWYANYNTGSSASGGWAESAKYGAALWQWSSTQRVPGISTNVDVSHVFDWETIKRVAQFAGPVTSPVFADVVGSAPTAASATKHPATASFDLSTGDDMILLEIGRAHV